MAKKILKLDAPEEYEFGLLAVICNLKDYKFCFELNETLHVHLKRLKDVELADAKRNRSLFTNYFSKMNFSELRVVVNKGSKGFLIPEKKNIDYFLIVNNAEKKFMKEFSELLKTQPWLQGVYVMQPAELKSVDNFLFFSN